MRAEIAISQETWQQLWPECEPLMRRQAEEVYGVMHKPFAVDFATIYRLQYAGVMFALAARERLHLQLVGYLFWFVSPDLESAGRKIATAGPWYVLPEYRKFGVGVRLMNLSEIILEKMKVGEIHAHSPIGNSKLEMWFDANGWKARQVQFVKGLKI